jgi:hypothetical protein
MIHPKIKKWVESKQETQQEDSAMTDLLNRSRNRVFYCCGWKNNTKNRFTPCCWNHLIGLPRKGNKEYPLFDYEKEIIRSLLEPSYLNIRQSTNEDYKWYQEQWKLFEEGKGPYKNESFKAANDRILRERNNRLIYPQKVDHLAIVKATGLGLTTLITRYILWCSMKDDKWKGTDVIILTGPNQKLSNDIITLMKNIFLPFGITFDTSVSTLIVNGVRIRAFPSDNLSAARGIPVVSMIYCDEASWFSQQSNKEIVDLIERYAGKSQSQIVLTSTPNRVGDLMHTIISQPYEQSFYKVLRLSYEWGVGKIYSEQDIEIAKKSSSFDREYNCSFNTPSGNCFTGSSIDRAIELGKKYPDTINREAEHALGVDPGFGSSSFGLVCLEHSDSIIKVVFAKQFDRHSLGGSIGFNDMVTQVWNVRNLVGNLNNVYIDMANTEFIEAVKQDFGDNTNWNYIHDQLKHYKDMNLRIEESSMKVIPVSFREEGASMLSHCKNLLEHEDNLIAINPKYTELIEALKGAQSIEYRLDKKNSPFPDLIDDIRLAAKYFYLVKE